MPTLVSDRHPGAEECPPEETPSSLAPPRWLGRSTSSPAVSLRLVCSGFGWSALGSRRPALGARHLATASGSFHRRAVPLQAGLGGRLPPLSARLAEPEASLSAPRHLGSARGALRRRNNRITNHSRRWCVAGTVLPCRGPRVSVSWACVSVS